MPQIWNIHLNKILITASGKTMKSTLDNELEYIHMGCRAQKQSTLTLQIMSVSWTNTNENQLSLFIPICTGSMEWWVIFAKTKIKEGKSIRKAGVHAQTVFIKPL